jgi:hypothetical protein
MNQLRSINENRSKTSDLLNEFFTVFFGVWLSFVLTSQNFSLIYAMAVLFITTLAVYRLIVAFYALEFDVFIRWFWSYLSTFLGFVLAVFAIIGFASVFIPESTNRPDNSQVLYLLFIVAIWILAFEISKFRSEISTREELQIWTQN